MNTLRIIFMGTPEFAVASLEALISAKLNVVAVITAPDKPVGRGLQTGFSAVKQSAVTHNIPVLQPPNLKSEDFLRQLKTYEANLFVVVAFRMLPEVVWSMPVLGTFNLHASLLPNYRGAAPINWAIINGEKETGVTTFFLQHEIDTGSIIFQEREPIHDIDDAGALYNRLMKKGGDLVVKTAKAIESENYHSVPQPAAEEIMHAPKIFKETCEVKWDQPAFYIHNFIRGLSPYPAAWATINGRTFKLFSSTVVSGEPATPGSYHTDNKNYLHVKAGDSWLAIDELQLEGKKRMAIGEFFRGNKI